MKGLEISRNFYREYGEKMLKESFPHALDRIAVGLIGLGSECLGFDDEISKDHDFDPGFCIFISKRDEDELAFSLERAYSKLPKEFMGYTRQRLCPVGGNRRGVLIAEDFIEGFLGAATAPDSAERWLYTPTDSLLALSSGELYHDFSGIISSVRDKIKKGYPEDIRRKKLAAHTVFMAQSGQYNYSRCISRGENGAAQLCIFEFVKHAISAVYLLNNRYEPFYKWAYRGMRELPVLASLEDSLVGLSELDNSPRLAKQKAEIIEDIALMLAKEFKRQDLTSLDTAELEAQAYAIVKGIKDPCLRNMHIMGGI